MPVQIEEMETQVQVSDAQGAAGLSAELVREITERVYALLLRDLQIERERARWMKPGQTPPGGKYGR